MSSFNDVTVLGSAGTASPSVEYSLLSPMLIVFGVAVVGVLIEAFAPRRFRYPVQLVLGVAGLAAAFVAVLLLAGTRSTAMMGSVAVDGPTLFLQATILLVSIPAVLLIAERGSGNTAEVIAQHDALGGFTPQASSVPGSVAEHEAVKVGIAQTEVFPLTLFAVGGMLLFPASNDLLTMFVALEVFSLPLYLLCGLARRRRLLSQEAALKYFLLGAFSSAFFVFGIALLYGYAGTVTLSGIADAARSGSGTDAFLWLGTALVAVGLLFKVGAVPFHSWIPDVYQGAPTPITSFMATATKIAAFGAILRVFYVALPNEYVNWRPLMWAVAILTMVVGSIVAVTQTDMKRMLAYSAIAHTGFILTAVVADSDAGLASAMFYLLAYGFSTVGAFAVVSLVRDADGEVATLSRWAGLGRRSPLVGVVFALFLLAFAGIPLTSGFIGKFAVFSAAAEGGAAPLVIVGVLCSAIAAYFYVRVIVLMFFTESAADAPTVVVPSALTSSVIGLGAGVTLILGILPQPVLDLAERAADFLH
ncbi:NADH-quinone oxidoreductase subunit NuoN [Rhodococcus sp. C3V]|uniref:NADH-quinone oxidoreductase subunit NuoN n=1 Tax=Rhodococcus sp. C3V TaxID=3034165 RepID=UPI0023E0AF0B|nr:NADH-quinone oxidoreductase subunit NuoN [Rhodococcus sp. C3V]MDF3315018.1 NADH-quinone oxidoreductase subunit NuoN [Rhodococcus sp. C3V]